MTPAGPVAEAPRVADLRGAVRTAQRRAHSARPLLRYWYRWKPLLLVVCLASLVLTMGWAAWVYVKAPHGFVDLEVYRLGIKTWWHGHNLYGKLPATVAGHLPFVYPPITALLLAGLAAPTWSHAVAGMLVASLAALALTLYVTTRRVWPEGGMRGAVLVTAVAVPAALQLEPVWDTLWYGQINIVLMLLVVADCLVPHPKWPRGLLIGIAAAIKLTPAVFLLYFLLRKDFRAAAWLAGSAAALTVLGFVVNWSGSLTYWFGASGGARSISGSAFFTNQTVDGFLARLSVHGFARTVLWLGLCAVLAGLAVLAIRRALRLGDVPLAVTVTALIGLMVSPTSWSNHWVYVAPALIVLAGNAVRRRRLGWLAAFLAVAWVFWYAPFLQIPYLGSAPMHWTVWQQIPGNAFCVLGGIALAVLAAPELPAVLAALRSRRVTLADLSPSLVAAEPEPVAVSTSVSAAVTTSVSTSVSTSAEG